MDFRHLALSVPDLRAAEEYYREVFAMDLIGRESWGSDGVAYALSPDKGWDDAEAAGIELQFVALVRDNVILALFAGDGSRQVQIVGLVLSEAEIAAVRSRLSGDEVMVEHNDYLEFLDPFELRWQLATDREFTHAGELADRWLEV